MTIWYLIKITWVGHVDSTCAHYRWHSIERVGNSTGNRLSADQGTLCRKNERMYYITLYMFWIELLAGEAIRKMRLPNELYAVSSSLLVALKWLVCSFYLGDSPEKWPTGPVRLPTRIREFSSKSNVHIWWNFSPGQNICHNKIIQILLFFLNLNFDGF